MPEERAAETANSQAADDWSRIGEYLDRLAFENDRLEAELKIRKQRRLERDLQSRAQASAGSSERLNEVAANAAYEASKVSEATAGMHLSYDALRRDLSGLMSELDDFKSTRAGLEARLGS